MTIKQKLHNIIFENDTKAGRAFDVALLWSILISVLLTIIDSIAYINLHFRDEFYFVEWIFTILFTIEYLLRIYSSEKPLKYIFSFWGLIDLLAILPTFLSIFFYKYHYLFVVRILRLLRVFRVLKLVRFNRESSSLMRSLKASSYKIGIFILAILAIVVLLGSLMYVVEGEENGFTSIPQSIYWAIITITTVGYGDIVPHTIMGKFISSFSMLIGYAIIAVPTGIVTVEMNKLNKKSKKCAACGNKNDEEANFCSECGAKIYSDEDEAIKN
ncbi:MAG TPA: ion transporter [Paludibacter sp.]|nr:ion transporter [Paludibacter sp.]